MILTLSKGSRSHIGIVSPSHAPWRSMASVCLELTRRPKEQYAAHRDNPIEKLWWHLKGYAAANRCCRSMSDSFTATWAGGFCCIGKGEPVRHRFAHVAFL